MAWLHSWFCKSSEYETLSQQIESLQNYVGIRITNLNRLIAHNQEKTMANFDQIKADVTAQKGVIASVKTLLANMAQNIIDIKSTVSQDAATQGALTELQQQIIANTAELAAAVEATPPVVPVGTPGEPIPQAPLSRG